MQTDNAQQSTDLLLRSLNDMVGELKKIRQALENRKENQIVPPPGNKSYTAPLTKKWR